LPSPSGDEGGYISLADTLLRDGTFGVYPTAYRLPLYPMLLGAVQGATGMKVPAYLVLNAFLGTAAVLLIYRIASHLAGERAARISLLLSVPNPFLMANTPDVLTENLYIPLVLGFLLALLVAQDDGPGREGEGAVWRRWLPWAVAGLLLGLCNLTRPSMLRFGILLPFCYLFVERRIGPKVRGAILLLVLSVVLLVPWWVRNAAVFGRFIPGTTGEGFVLLGAYNEKAFTDPAFIGSWVNYETDISPAPFRGRTEYDRDRIASAMAKEYAAAHWTGIPRTLPWRLLRAFYWYPNVVDRFTEAAGTRRLSSIWGFLFTFVLVYPMAATEGVRRLRDRRFLAPFLLVAWFLLVILAAYGSQRMRLPIEGVMIVFAAAGWDRFTGKMRSTPG
jgi:4-amino-4-deoxy-L-arabinose transferase-like glycosyltransferase